MGSRDAKLRAASIHVEMKLFSRRNMGTAHTVLVTPRDKRHEKREVVQCPPTDRPSLCKSCRAVCALRVQVSTCNLREGRVNVRRREAPKKE